MSNLVPANVTPPRKHGRSLRKKAFAGNPPNAPHNLAPFRIGWHELWPIIINALFAVLGAFLMVSEPDKAIVTVAIFGSGAYFLSWLQWRRYKDHKLMVTNVEVAGGVRILPRGGFLLWMGLWLVVLGLVLVKFGGHYPEALQWLGGFIALSGTILATLVILRIMPPGFLQFEAEGLMIGGQGWQTLVPLEKINTIAQGEMHSNPVIYLGVTDVHTLVITPASAEAKARKAIRGQAWWQWSPLTIFPMHYAIPSPILAGAIARYVEDAAARTNLGREQVLPPYTKSLD
jgi:hypothetical protein